MNQKEEKKQSMLNLCLPYIELDNNDVYSHVNYPCDGLFFVKTKDGLIHFVEVSLEEKNVLYNSFPPNIANKLVEQVAQLSFKEQIDERLNRLEEVLNHTCQQVGECTEIVRSEMRLSMNGIFDQVHQNATSLKDIPQTTVKLLNEHQPQPQAKEMGFVSQEALVEIIRTIK